MKTISQFIKWYLYITTGIIIVCAVNFAAAGMEVIPGNTLWQILWSGFLTTLVTVIIFPYGKEGDNKFTTICGGVLHYLALCVVMIFCGNSFGWISYDVYGITLMSISVAAVYLLVFCAYYILDIRQAEEINRKLKERYQEESK